MDKDIFLKNINKHEKLLSDLASNSITIEFFDENKLEIIDEFLFDITLKNRNISNSVYIRSKINTLLVDESDLGAVLFYENIFEECTFKTSYLRKSEFKDCNFSQCVFVGCDLSKVEFVNCNFINCRFINCNLGWSYINNCNLKNVEFDKNNLESLIIADSKIENTKITDNIINTKFPIKIFKNDEKVLISAESELIHYLNKNNNTKNE